MGNTDDNAVGGDAVCDGRLQSNPANSSLENVVLQRIGGESSFLTKGYPAKINLVHIGINLDRARFGKGHEDVRRFADRGSGPQSGHGGCRSQHLALVHVKGDHHSVDGRAKRTTVDLFIDLHHAVAIPLGLV
jgi:hypothetical protein